jgi:hypothetical protein
MINLCCKKTAHVLQIYIKTIAKDFAGFAKPLQTDPPLVVLGLHRQDARAAPPVGGVPGVLRPLRPHPLDRQGPGGRRVREDSSVIRGRHWQGHWIHYDRGTCG